MGQYIYLTIQILCILFQLGLLAYIDRYRLGGYFKWKLFRSKNYKFLVPRDSDWKEWLVDNLGPPDKHWKVEADYTSFIFFKHNLQFVDITVKRKYNPQLLQFRLIYEQQRP